MDTTDPRPPIYTKARTGVIAALAKRKKHYRRKNAIADIMQKAGYAELATKLRNCQETESLVCCSECGAHWYVLTRCRQRICPLCAFEEAKRRAKFLKAMTAHMKYPKMLTLTMPRSSDEPQQQIRHLRQCFNKLRRHEVFSQVVGGAYQIEVKPKPDGWHIHLHAIFDGPYMPQQRIFTAWRTITGADVPQVDIRSADNDAAKEYVCKYASKAADYDRHSEDVVRWYQATKGQRLFATFGKWYNATMEELLPAGEFQPEAPPCPNCGRTQTAFFARDGPFLFGQDWTTLQRFYCGEDIDIRPIHEIRDELDNPASEPADSAPCTQNDPSSAAVPDTSTIVS